MATCTCTWSGKACGEPLVEFTYDSAILGNEQALFVCPKCDSTDEDGAVEQIASRT